MTNSEAKEELERIFETNYYEPQALELIMGEAYSFDENKKRFLKKYVTKVVESGDAKKILFLIRNSIISELFTSKELTKFAENYSSQFLRNILIINL